ncbi:hypothetical protein EYR27_02770 [Xanthomonas oryzae]|nr:hypothetical protein EYR27_02770 [Xanthomonas oryzae]
MRGLKRRPSARDRPGARHASRMHRRAALPPLLLPQPLTASASTCRMHDFRQEGSAVAYA